MHHAHCALHSHALPHPCPHHPFPSYHRYLKKHNVRDWLRVIASNKDRSVYELRYFNIADNEAEDEE